MQRWLQLRGFKLYQLLFMQHWPLRKRSWPLLWVKVTFLNYVTIPLQNISYKWHMHLRLRIITGTLQPVFSVVFVMPTCFHCITASKCSLYRFSYPSKGNLCLNTNADLWPKTFKSYLLILPFYSPSFFAMLFSLHTLCLSNLHTNKQPPGSGLGCVREQPTSV